MSLALCRLASSDAFSTHASPFPTHDERVGLDGGIDRHGLHVEVQVGDRLAVGPLEHRLRPGANGQIPSAPDRSSAMPGGMRFRESFIQEAFDICRPVEDLLADSDPQRARVFASVSLGVQGTGREPQIVGSLLKGEQRFRRSLRPHPGSGLSIQHGRSDSEDCVSQ